MKLACALLAAGSGERFGGGKLWHPIEGVPMIERALTVYGMAAFKQRVLVVRPNDAAMHTLGIRYGFTVTENPLAQQGIGTSVAAAMRTLLSDNAWPDGVMFAVADQPYLTVATVERLTAQFCTENDRIVAPCVNGRRGNPVAFPKSTFAALSALSGDVGGSAVIKTRPELLSLCPVNDERELTDIDYRNEVRQ